MITFLSREAFPLGEGAFRMSRCNHPAEVDGDPDFTEDEASTPEIPVSQQAGGGGEARYR
jgi:hypothetical protein